VIAKIFTMHVINNSHYIRVTIADQMVSKSIRYDFPLASHLISFSFINIFFIVLNLKTVL
jgi:hypothetical protein